ncbi:glycoside hydrolase family 5 protein, partial [Candidatus Bathyarchaeota archaeon]|nr:glycoside hydrolase family 5 protein [Candidatus Bathyarchaeota archaeon]
TITSGGGVWVWIGNLMNRVQSSSPLTAVGICGSSPYKLYLSYVTSDWITHKVTSATTLMANIQYCIELMRDRTNGAVVVWLNGVEVPDLHITGLSLLSSGITEVDVGVADCWETATLYFDDIAVDSSYIGAGTGSPSSRYTLKVQSSTNGNTNPTAGTYTYNSGTVVSISSLPSDGYHLSQNVVDGVNMGTFNPYSITMNANHVFSTIFVQDTVPSLPPSKISALHVEGNKLKDANGNVIYLRGSNYFMNTGDHSKSWLTSSGGTTSVGSDWDTQVVPAIKSTFDRMKALNFNYFRMHTSAQNWLQDRDYPSHMQQITALAAERGIYISIDVYNVADTYPNDSKLPFPPYEGTASLALIPSQQAFVNLWGLIANTMKNSPNTILGEIQNEPFGTYNDDTNNWYTVDYPTFLSVCQKIIAKIRTTTDLPIMVNWGFDVGGSLSSDGKTLWLWAPSVKLDTFADDPRIQGTNIIYSFHWYQNCPLRNGVPLNDLTSLTQYLSLAGIDSVASRKVVLASELGGLRGDTASQTWMSNAIDLLVARGIGFANWVWYCPFNSNHGDEIVALGATNYALTDKGQIIESKVRDIARALK